jgi:hypothetical protein
MKKIKDNSIRQLRKRIKRLNSLDLSKYNKDAVSGFINNSFKIPYHTWTQPCGYMIYRSQINESDENPFDSIKRIRFNPNPESIERANLKGKGTGYASDSLKVAAIENCQYELKTSSRKSFHLTVGVWIPQRELNVMIIYDSKKGRRSGTDLHDAYLGVKRKLIREEYSRKDIRSWTLRNNFFANQFAKEFKVDENEYLFSALLSNTIFKCQDPVIDAIWYPKFSKDPIKKMSRIANNGWDHLINENNQLPFKYLQALLDK